MAEQGCDKTVESLLFFSIDIVDSACYKFSFVNDWGTHFQTFYKEFPHRFNKTCKELVVSRLGKREIQCPTIWKIVGDELLFYVKIKEAWDLLPLHLQKDERERIQPYVLVLLYTVAFIKSIKDYNHEAQEFLKHNKPAFKVKGCAWFADVIIGKNYDPRYGNLQVGLSCVKGSHVPQIDFIGRQIDIGFRISKYSTLNRLVLSVEYGILLLRDNYLTLEDEGINLHYDGRKSIKGPLEQLGYPLVFVDMDDKFEHSEAELMSTSHQRSNQVTLMRLLEEYLYKTNFVLYYPFVHEKDRLFYKKPFT